MTAVETRIRIGIRLPLSLIRMLNNEVAARKNRGAKNASQQAIVEVSLREFFRRRKQGAEA